MIIAVIILIVVGVSAYAFYYFVTGSTDSSLIRALLGAPLTNKTSSTTPNAINEVVKQEFQKFNNDNCYTLLKSNSLPIDMVFEEKNGKIEYSYLLNNQKIAGTIDASNLYFFDKNLAPIQENIAYYGSNVYLYYINPNQFNIKKMTLTHPTISTIKINADEFNTLSSQSSDSIIQNTINFGSDTIQFAVESIRNTGLLADKVTTEYLLFIKYGNKFGLFSYPINNDRLLFNFGGVNLPPCEVNNEVLTNVKNQDKDSILQLLLQKPDAITTDPNQKSSPYYIDKNTLFNFDYFAFTDIEKAKLLFDTYNYEKFLQMNKCEFLRRCTFKNYIRTYKCPIDKVHIEQLKNNKDIIELPTPEIEPSTQKEQNEEIKHISDANYYYNLENCS